MTGKVQRWKLYLQDKDFYLCHVPGKEVHQYVPDALSSLCENHMLSNESEKPAHKRHQAFLASIEPKHRISDAAFKQIAAVLNSMVGHWGLQKCKVWPLRSNYSPLRLWAPPRLTGAFSSTLVDSEHPMSFTLIRVQPSATNSSQSYHGYRRSILGHSVLERRERSRRTCQSRSHVASSCHAF